MPVAGTGLSSIGILLSDGKWVLLTGTVAGVTLKPVAAIGLSSTDIVVPVTGILLPDTALAGM